MKNYSLFSYLLIFHEHLVILAIVKVMYKKILRLITYQDVVQLKVSVDNSLLMYVIQSFGDLYCPVANCFEDFRISTFSWTMFWFPVKSTLQALLALFHD